MLAPDSSPLPWGRLHRDNLFGNLANPEDDWIRVVCPIIRDRKTKRFDAWVRGADASMSEQVSCNAFSYNLTDHRFRTWEVGTTTTDGVRYESEIKFSDTEGSAAMVYFVECEIPAACDPLFPGQKGCGMTTIDSLHVAEYFTP
jgi:hypothetical protein